jgi:hypothetical protein
MVMTLISHYQQMTITGGSMTIYGRRRATVSATDVPGPPRPDRAAAPRSSHQAGGCRRRQRVGVPRYAAWRPDGHEAWKQVVEHGYEGYVAKDETSV